MTKAVLLARFSPRPDAKDSASNETQLRDLRAECEKRQWEIVAEFADEDVSGDDEDRDGLWQAVAALKKGYVLLVWKGDRLARSVYLSEYLHREAKKIGARIEYLHGAVEDTDEGVLLRQILASFDEYTKKVSAKRTASMMRSMQSNGVAMSKRPPYGMKLAKGPPRPETKRNPGRPTLLLIENDDEQRVLEKMKAWRAEGLGSLRIIDKLISEKIKPRGRRWHKTTVDRILERLTAS